MRLEREWSDFGGGNAQGPCVPDPLPRFEECILPIGPAQLRSCPGGFWDGVAPVTRTVNICGCSPKLVETLRNHEIDIQLSGRPGLVTSADKLSFASHRSARFHLGHSHASDPSRITEFQLCRVVPARVCGDSLRVSPIFGSVTQARQSDLDIDCSVRDGGPGRVGHPARDNGRGGPEVTWTDSVVPASHHQQASCQEYASNVCGSHGLSLSVTKRESTSARVRTFPPRIEHEITRDPAPSASSRGSKHRQFKTAEFRGGEASSVFGRCSNGSAAQADPAAPSRAALELHGRLADTA
jgi:hypothetical protein